MTILGSKMVMHQLFCPWLHLLRASLVHHIKKKTLPIHGYATILLPLTSSALGVLGALCDCLLLSLASSAIDALGASCELPGQQVVVWPGSRRPTLRQQFSYAAAAVISPLVYCFRPVFWYSVIAT